MEPTAYWEKRIWIRPLLHSGILVVFLLIPVWYRLPVPLPLLPNYYVTRFLILAPLLWSIGWWLVAGVPGFQALTRDSRRYWAISLLLLAAWTLLSTRWAFIRTLHPDVATTSAIQFAVALLFSIVVACAGPTTKQISTTLVIGLVWNSLLTIIQAGNQHHVGLQFLGEFPMTLDRPGASILLAGNWRWLRPYGLLPHPNMLAGFLVVGLLASVRLMFETKRRTWFAGSAALALGTWAILLTFSRGAWLGLVAGGLLILLLVLPRLYRQRSTRRRFLATGVILLVITIGFALTFWPLLAARAGVGEERVELRSIADRVVFTQLAERAIREAPLLGVGTGNFPWRSAYYLAETDYDLRGDNVHNIYLLAWAELGIVGIGLLATAMIAGIATFTAAARRGGIETIEITLFGAYIALALIGLVDHYPWTILHFQTLWWSSIALALRPAHAGQ